MTEQPKDVVEVAQFIAQGMEVLDGLVKQRELNKQRSLGLLPPRRRDAHIAFQSTILKLIGDYSREMIADPSEETLYQMALLTNLAQSVDPTYEMLISGLYAGASALIRQSYEMNARLAEIQQQTNWSSGRTPNVGHLPMDVARYYGELSAVAHFSMQELANLTAFEIAPGTQAHSLAPVVREEPLARLFAFQLLTLVLTVRHLVNFFESVFDSDLDPYRVMAGRGLLLLHQEGMLEPHRSSNGETQ